MIKKIPKKDFSPNQVVFVKIQRQAPKPAKIILKSSYGTYKIKFYGSKCQQYASQYMIEPYNKDLAQYIGQNGKKNKKLIKYLKTAQRDHQQFLENQPKVSVAKYCKQEEQDMEDQGNNKGKINQQFANKYETIENLKCSTLIQDYHSCKQTTFSYNDQGCQRVFREKSKDLLIKKLMWAIQDIYLEKVNYKTESIISEIMQSQIIEPSDYVRTSLFQKINTAIAFLKKNKKPQFKSYLQSRQALIFKGVQNYLDNYSVFLRVRERFLMFLRGQDEQSAEKNVQFNQIRE